MTIACKNSNKSIYMMMNADGQGRILVVAQQEDEYWFTVGWYKSEKTAIRGARKQLAALGYELNA